MWVRNGSATATEVHWYSRELHWDHMHVRDTFLMQCVACALPTEVRRLHVRPLARLS